MTRLRAVPAAPDYPEHRGRRVTWEPWRQIRIMSLPAHDCAGCGHVGDPWSTAGLVHPLPGEQVDSTRVRQSKAQPGRRWQERVTVPAWPVKSLTAFCCPACARLDIYDHDDAFRPVDLTRPALF